MHTRTLGQQQITISALGLGCMGMSEFYGESDDAQSMLTLNRARDIGINFFDTADTYGLGHNEQLLGQWLRQLSASQRHDVQLATKFGIVRSAGSTDRRIDNSPAYIRAACEASLQRLGVESIALYYCHRRDSSVPIEDVVGAMADLVRAGKVQQLGLSEVSVDTLIKAHRVHPIAAIQSEYSLWQRSPETELLKTCQQLACTFVAYSPLGRAFLTGAVDTATLADNDFRKSNPRFLGEQAQHNRQRVEELSAMAQRLGCSNAQLALAFLLHKYAHVVPIPGTRRVTYLEQNVAASELVLAAEDMAALDALFPPDAQYGERYAAGGMQGIEQITHA